MPSRKITGMTHVQSHAFLRIKRWRQELIDGASVMTVKETEARLERIEQEMVRFFPGEYARLRAKHVAQVPTTQVVASAAIETNPLAS